MVIRDLSLEQPVTNESATFCVVGAGVAGLLLATRLARSKRRVIVLESGSMRFDPEIHALNEIDDPAGRYTRAMTGRYRGLGGSSTRWGGRMIPLSDGDSGDRPYLKQPGWPISGKIFQSYDRELEALFSLTHDPYDELESVDTGLPPGNDEDFRARWAKCPTFKRCNIAAVLGDELRLNRYLTVWLNATVNGFDLDAERGRLVALQARSLTGQKIVVRAEQFAIAAGTIESTRLLLMLNEASDRHAFAGTNALGCYFQDHLKAEVAVVDRQRPDLTNHLLGYRFVGGTRRDLHLELSPVAQQRDRVSSAFVYVAMDLSSSGLEAVRNFARGLQQQKLELKELGRAMKDVPLLASGAFWRLWNKQLFVPRGVNFRLMTAIEQLPHRDNRITLSEKKDRLGAPIARFHWAPRASEERVFRSTVNRLQRYWHRSGLGSLCPLVLAPAAADPMGSIIDKAEPCAHPSGSARMGGDSTTSVVRADLRCHAVPNLAIASAAVFPTAGSANPTFTIMKLALWLADSYLKTFA